MRHAASSLLRPLVLTDFVNLLLLMFRFPAKERRPRLSNVEDIRLWRRMKRKPGREGKRLEDVWLRQIDSGKWLNPESGLEMYWEEWARDYFWCAPDDLPDDEEEIAPVTCPPAP